LQRDMLEVGVNLVPNAQVPANCDRDLTDPDREKKMNITPERTRERIIMLVILILVCIAGITALLYKLDHPVPIKMLRSY